MSRRFGIAALCLVVTISGAAWMATRSHSRAPTGAGALDRLLGPAPSGLQVDFTLVLRLPGQRRLERFLNELNDPSSPRYRRFIDAAQFGERFGLSRTALAQARRHLERLGIRVTRSYPQRTTLDVQASGAALRRVFGVRLMEYVDADGHEFHAPALRANVPSELAAAVTAVAGLNSRPMPRPFAAPTQIGFKARDLARAYDFERLWGSGIRGAGQTIAVYSQFTFDNSDVDRVCNSSVTTACVSHVPVNGGTSRKDPEAELDVETIHGIAPDATVLNYESPMNTDNVRTWPEAGRAFVSSIVAAVNQVVSDGRARIMSISYGFPDSTSLDAMQPFTKEDVRAGDQAFAAALADGVNIFVASGDQGAYQCQQIAIGDHSLCVAWPAESASVIAVGGTLLDIRNDGTYLEEAGWQDTLSGWGGGGGLTQRDARPSWQTLSVQGARNRYSNGKRQLPDVAGPASPASGMFVVYGGQPLRGPVGGTSASAPFWAGVAALISQQAEKRHAGRLAFLNPLLYRLAASRHAGLFHDVVRGGNRYYPATAGWDYATGLGSPDVFNLSRAVVAELRR